MDITFERVQSLTDDDLSILPKQQVLSCIQIYAALNDDGDDDKCLVFEFAFTRFTAVLTLCEIDELVCNQLISPLKGNFDETIEYAASAAELDDFAAESDDVIRQIQTIFQLFLQLLTSIHQKSLETDEYCLSHMEHALCHALYFLNRTTASTFFHSDNDIKTLLDSMQMTIINVTTSPKCQIDELQLCCKVLVELIQLASQQSDVKSNASTWKHISKLAIGYHTVYRTLQQQEHDPIESNDGSLDWLSVCIESICKSIAENVQKGLDAFPEQQKESVACIKLAVFYQKILQTLSNVYKNDEFRGQHFVIQLSEMIFSVCDNLDAELLHNSFQSLSDELCIVLGNVFDCDRFAVELLIKFHDDHIRVCIEIMKQLLQSSAIDNPYYLSCENIEQKNIMHHMLHVCIPTELIHLYTSSNLHTNLVNICAGLWLISNDDQVLSRSLEKIFVEAGLSDDIYRMPLLMDIWMLYLRHTTNENRLLYCQQWLSWHKHLSPIAQSPSNVFIRKILAYTLNLLSIEQRSQIARDMAAENPSHNDTLLRLELAANGDVSEFKQFGQKIVNRIKQCFVKLNPRTELVTTDECTELIQALSCFQWATVRNLQTVLSDADLTNCLTDALLRLKTKRVTIVLSTVLRMLLGQKHFAGGNFQALEIDHSDSLEVRKFYAMELIELGRRNSNGILNESRSIIDDMDDLMRARIQMAVPQIDKNPPSHLSDDYEAGDVDYLNQIFSWNRKFGCTTLESCINQNALFKQHFDKIMREAKELNAAFANNPNINLKRFSNEINYVNRLFDQLSNKMQTM